MPKVKEIRKMQTTKKARNTGEHDVNVQIKERNKL